jgi:hypothetical protein
LKVYCSLGQLWKGGGGAFFLFFPSCIYNFVSIMEAATVYL